MTTIEELQAHLGSWNKLHAFFQEDPAHADLITLLDLETRGQNREYMRQRITARLATVEKKLRMEGKL